MTTPAPRGWLASPAHRAWLIDESARLLRFFRTMVDADGNFAELDTDGLPFAAAGGGRPEQLLTVTRAVHSYALGELMGIPGCAGIVEQGIEAILRRHVDPREGGYLELAGGDLPPRKSAYGHAFVLLAASSALAAGHDRASALVDDVLEVIDRHFWSEEDGASRESFSPTWDDPEPYRGANSNMHLCEAFLAASAVLDRPQLVTGAVRIVMRLIDGEARAHGWMLPEHYDEGWRPCLVYNRDRPDDIFRPYGVTPGHLFEWSRLACTTWLARGQADAWLIEAGVELFARATAIGWDAAEGGIAYTTDFDGSLMNDDRYWWPVTEAIAASAVLARITGDDRYTPWYEKFWNFAADHLIDHQRGGWFPQLDRENRQKSGPWYGKPDIYHALQACIIPIAPLGPGVASSLMQSW